MIFATPELPKVHLEVLNHIDRFRDQLRYSLQQQPRRWTGTLARTTFAQAIQGSNSIEGYNVSIDDAVAAVEGEEPLDATTEDWLAVKGYRIAMSYVLQLANDSHFEYSAGLLRSLHYMMIAHDVQKNPGKWRPGSIYVKREPTGETVYEGPPALEVPGLMKQLIDQLQSKSDAHVLVRAAMAHLNLVMIHPFSDGNGRMGRALQTLVLSQEGILDPRFSSIEEYLGAHRDEYYKVLGEVGRGAWHPERDALAWVTFSLTAHYRQAKTLLQRSESLDKLWDRLEAELIRRKLNQRYIQALLDAACGFRVRNATYRKYADISENLASKDLSHMVEQNLLVPRGEKRGRYYEGSKELLGFAKDIDVRGISKTNPFEPSRSGGRPFGPKQGKLGV